MAIDRNFLKQGYHESRNDKQVVVRSELIDKHAREYGELFASRDRNVQVSSSQLRAFYADVKDLERKLKELERQLQDGGKGAFNEYLYLIKMLKSKASYIQGKRSGGRVSREFRDYIHACVDAIEDYDDFKAFLKFFESTVGFYYGAGGERIA